MNSYGVEKAVVIRYPSTANLMVDSADRNTTLNPSPWDFQITKPQSTMNGFFTRIGTTEVVLEWCMPNILDGTITFDISGATVRSTSSYNILSTFFNMAQLLDNIASAFDNTNGVTFAISQANGQVTIDSTGGKFIIVSTPLALAAALPVGGALSASKAVGSTGLCPDLRRFRYLDFTSPQIT